MIKKTAVIPLLLVALASPANAQEHPFSEHGDRKRVSLNVIGVGGAVTVTGAVFFFVGRSGASLHVNPDGSLKPRGLLEEAYAATSLQRVSMAIFAVGVATTITGTVLLLLTRKPVVSVAPWLGVGQGGVAVGGVF
ncbi:MAG: hypothetical protein JNJ54_10945 [Myxococcaceae bacterium]|nr:hypothetical protein [Myxococcaceae bacterium]